MKPMTTAIANYSIEGQIARGTRTLSGRPVWEKFFRAADSGLWRAKPENRVFFLHGVDHALQVIASSNPTRAHALLAQGR